MPERKGRRIINPTGGFRVPGNLILENLISARSVLLEWCRSNLRDFPWRKNPDPYRLLISEMMLRRTRAEQVAPVFAEFTERYPDFKSLLSAGREETGMFFRRLGLLYRVDDIMKMADYVWNVLHGSIPCRKADILKIPGIGEYTASVFMSVICGCPEAPLDTNTVRIASRVFNLEMNDSSRRKKIFRDAVSLLIDPSGPAMSVFCLIDLAAILCRPEDPRCGECPLNSICAFNLLRDKNSH